MPKKTFQVQLSLAERARLQALITTGSATAHIHNACANFAQG